MQTNTDKQYYLQAQAFYEQGKYRQSIGAYIQAIQENPNFYEARLNLAKLLLETEQFQNAIEQFEILTRYKPDNYYFYFCLGYSYQQLCMIDQSIAAYTKAIYLNDDSEDMFFNLGILYTDKAEYDAAIGAYQKAISINPEYIEAYDNLGVLYSKNKETELARQMFESAIDINMEYPLSHYNLACLLKNEGNFEEALNHFSMASQNGYNTPELSLYCGECLLNEGEPNKAIQAFLKAIQQNIKSTKIYYKLGLAYSEMGLYSEAITNLRIYLNTDLDITDRDEINEIISSLEQAL